MGDYDKMRADKGDLTMSTDKSISSQVQIEDKLIESLLSSLFKGSSVQEIRYLSYAFTNKTALVRFSSGERAVIKICVKEDRFSKLKLEVDLIERISSETGLPVPKVLHKDLSMKKFQYPFVVYSFLPGENLVDSIIHVKDKNRLGIELGRVAGQLHQITFDRPKFSLAAEDSQSSWIEIIGAICKTGIDRLRESNYSRIADAERYVQKNIAKIVEPKDYSLIHRDLQPQNLHWDSQSQKIVGIFDFESAMSGDRHFEFNFLERKLFKTYPDVRKGFYSSYSKHNRLDRNYEDIVKFYEVVRDLYFYDRDLHYGELDRANGDIESIERLIFDDWLVG